MNLDNEGWAAGAVRVVLDSVQVATADKAFGRRPRRVGSNVVVSKVRKRFKREGLANLATESNERLGGELGWQREAVWIKIAAHDKRLCRKQVSM